MANSSASYVGWVVDEEHQEEKKQLHSAQALTAGITAMCSQWWLQYCWEAITFTVSRHVKPSPAKATMFFSSELNPQIWALKSPHAPSFSQEDGQRDCGWQETVIARVNVRLICFNYLNSWAITNFLRIFLGSLLLPPTFTVDRWISQRAAPTWHVVKWLLHKWKRHEISAVD